MGRNDRNVTMENVRIIFRNFAGREDMYNREGDRNFAVLLDQETAKMMANDGWNVKVLPAREEGTDDQPYLPVSVSFKNIPPKIVMITSRNRSVLDEDLVAMLDHADILTCDLIVNPYEWTVNGKTGVKAYLKTMFVTIEEDDLERKYADMEADQHPGG